MRILLEGRNLANYLAKCHEAFRTGLRALFDARSFGRGYPGGWYRFVTRSYSGIIRRVFPDASPHVVLTRLTHPYGLEFRGMAEVDAVRATILGDYWVQARKCHAAMVEFLEKNRLDAVLTYFPQPMEIWRDTPLSGRFIHMPPSFDPKIFHDRKMPKDYDVGFLAAGTARPMSHYPERSAIHRKLLGRKDLRYLWARHPGWRDRIWHPLVGEGFSRAINSCRMFITTGGRLKNAHAKYVEILASRTLLLADEPIGAQRLGLEDGVNYVRIAVDDVLDKVDYYLGHPEEAERIAAAGYAMAHRLHHCYRRALEFYEAITEKFPHLKECEGPRDDCDVLADLRTQGAVDAGPARKAGPADRT